MNVLTAKQTNIATKLKVFYNMVNESIAFQSRWFKGPDVWVNNWTNNIVNHYDTLVLLDVGATKKIVSSNLNSQGILMGTVFGTVCLSSQLDSSGNRRGHYNVTHAFASAVQLTTGERMALAGWLDHTEVPFLEHDFLSQYMVELEKRAVALGQSLGHGVVASEMALFEEKYNSIEKEITFNPRWVGPEGNYDGVVVGANTRLLLPHGEWMKAQSKAGNKVILVGTHFGIVSIYPHPRTMAPGKKPAVAYCITPAFVEALKRTFKTEPRQNGLLQFFDEMASYGQEFWDMLAEMKSYHDDYGLPVNDGMVVEVKPPRHQKSDSYKKPSSLPQPTHLRANA